MNGQHQALYARLQSFSVDEPDSALTFSDRLARENGWTREFSLRAIEEYKRFVFLAMVAGHTVTPSDQVDQVWHLHLTYTHSYWDDLCGQVLQRPLHHGPTKGGSSENEKYLDLYERTKESYRRVFEEHPPADLWPESRLRFGEDLCFRRVNWRRYWIIPRPTNWLRSSPRGLSGVMGALMLPVFGFMLVNPLDLRGPDFLLLFGAMFLISVSIAWILRNGLRREWGEAVVEEETVLDPYDAAYLRGGKVRVVEAAVAPLVRAGVYTVESEGKSSSLSASKPLPPQAHSMEKAVFNALEASDGKPRSREFRRGLSDSLASLKDSLSARGLVETRESFHLARWSCIVAMLPLLCLGTAKLLVGIQREKPVGFLVMGLIVSAAVTVGLFVVRPRTTRAGKRLINRLRFGQRDRAADGPEPKPSGLDDELALTVGLFGLAAALSSTDPLVRLMATPQESNWGFATFIGDGGGGCGGGGCGGGCGGCGG